MSDDRLEAYVKLPYMVTLRPLPGEDGGGWLAEIPDLPGCTSDGETSEQALANIEDAKRLWLSTALKRGVSINSPSKIEEYSGRVTLRMPRTLHRKLSELAAKEGVSLNQIIVDYLSFSYGAFERPMRLSPVSALLAPPSEDVLDEINERIFSALIRRCSPVSWPSCLALKGLSVDEEGGWVGGGGTTQVEADSGSAYIFGHKGRTART